MKRAVAPVPTQPADQPATWTIPDVGAIQAVYRGTASEHQQSLALDWIIKQAAQIGGQSFRAGDSHATAFHEGRRFVGMQIMGLLAINIEDLKRTNPNG